jgi:hypothetical protein
MEMVLSFSGASGSMFKATSKNESDDSCAIPILTTCGEKIVSLFNHGMVDE